MRIKAPFQDSLPQTLSEAAVLSSKFLNGWKNG